MADNASEVVEKLLQSWTPKDYPPKIPSEHRPAPAAPEPLTADQVPEQLRHKPNAPAPDA